MAALKPFWMVWCYGGSAPTVKHDTYQSALSEASRLARLTGDGTNFVVLKAVSVAYKSDIVVQEIQDENPDSLIPF